MTWVVEFHPDFDQEFEELSEEVQDSIRIYASLLEKLGPFMERPHVGTLHGSRFKNMKELRFDASDGVWRVAFAFDPKRRAIFLVAGDKSGGSQDRFYRQLLARADERFVSHLSHLTKRS